MGLKSSALVAASAVLAATAASTLVFGSASAAPTPSVLTLSASGGATTAVAINESISKTLTVKNTTANTVSFTLAVSNTAGNAWSLGTTTCTASLLAGRFCTVNAVFAPTVAGAATADLVLNDGSGGIASSPLASTGLQHFTVTPPTGNYGLWAQGSTSPAKTYTVTNNHQSPITLSSIVTTNPDFIRTDGTCTSTVPAKASCTVDIAFAPRSAGLDFSTGQLVVAAATMGTQTVELSGRKVGAILVTPSPVDFAKVAIGASVDKVVTVSSRASFPVSLGGASLTALGNYSIPATTCAATIAATSTCTITVRFAPATGGAKAVRLLVPYNEGAGSVAFSVNVNGIGVTVPGAPTGVRATPGDGAAVVSWTAPSADGGTPITGYKIVARANGVDGPPTIVDAATTSTTITGLTNGTAYTFTVAATNAQGAGVASAPSAATTPVSPGPDCSAFPYAPPNTDFHGCDFSGVDADNSTSSTPIDLTGDDFSGANFSNARLVYLLITDANFSSANLDGANFKGSALGGANFTGANLTGANLAGVDLAGVNLTGADLTGATLTNVSSGGIVGTPAALPTDWMLRTGYLIGPSASLSGAALLLANLDGANLTGANVQYADLQGASLAGTDLTGAGLLGVHSGNISGTPAALPNSWSLVKGYLIGPSAELGNAQLAGADLTGLNFINANLSGADLSGANLSGANLLGVNLDGADLTGANVAGVHSGQITGTPVGLPVGRTLVSGYLVGPGALLQNAGFFGADLSGIDLTGANLTGASFSGANLDGTNLSGATLTGVASGNITGTPAGLPVGWSLVNGYLVGPGASLQNADLSGASLNGLNLSNANLLGASLLGANLSGAHLNGADLSYANLQQADVTGANFTGATLNGIQSGAGFGPPAALPAGWTWDGVNGAFVPPV